jgi:hypothetical protein
MKPKETRLAYHFRTYLRLLNEDIMDVVIIKLRVSNKDYIIYYDGDVWNENTSIMMSNLDLI